MSGNSTPQPPAGLPARPPPSAVSNNAAFAAFKPRAVVAAPAPRNASNSPAPGTYSYPSSTYGVNYSQQATAAPVTQSYYPGTATAAYSSAPAAQSYYGNTYGAAYPTQPEYGQTPPQIKNPFAPPPTRATGGSLYGSNNYDPEYEAQIQQWQSAYMAKDDGAPKANLGKSGKGEGAASAGGANAIPLGAAASRAQTSTPTVAQAGPTAAPVDPSGKEKTVVRSGGGQKWEDPTLLEWGDHPRLFVGNLAGEVTDESLFKAFAKYPSVQKARVVRDKRTTKSRGFGFVSLSNTDEFFQAAKEMNGKYIGSHPVLIKRAETEIKAVVKKDDKKYGKNNKNNKNKSKEEKDILGANTGSGVQKKQVKPSGQYKVLG